MKPVYRTLGVGALVSLAVSIGSASAQAPWPSYPVYARVTITNQTDIAVVFHSRWGNEAAKRDVLDPGRSVTLETTFPAGTPKPELTVEFRARPGAPLDALRLPSGHVDPATDNPGRVYDFYRQRSNVGEIVTLTAR
jgi:hypothetical protein